MTKVIYLIINESSNKTYIGWTNNIDQRINQHKLGQVRTTKNFGNFSWQILEKLDDNINGRSREKYWKSAAGRRKIKIILNNN